MVRLRASSALAAAALALSLAGGCTTTLMPASEIADPVPVILLDHGYTPSLVVPVDDREELLTRYAYGDWRWYAEGRQGVFDFFRALIWPSRGALGHREIPGPATVEHVLGTVPVAVSGAYLLHVEREALRAFNSRMSEIIDENRDSLLVSDRVDLTFVRHPRRYTLFHNSNHAAAGWLRALGVRVRGPVLLSRWRVVDAPSRPGSPSGRMNRE